MNKYSKVISSESYLLFGYESEEEKLCDFCNQFSIDALKFTCKQSECNDYSLCAICYCADKHDVNHRFKRYLDQYTECCHLPPRKFTQKDYFNGIFAGAIVERQQNLNNAFNDENEDTGHRGYVLAVIQLLDSPDIYVRVSWENGVAYTHLVESIKPKPMHYYLEHMPISRRYYFPVKSQEEDNLNDRALEHYQRCPYITFRSKSQFGNLIIFNHENFEFEEQRKGSHKDKESLMETFKKFYFQTEVKDDLTLEDIKTAVNKLSKRDFSDSACLIVIIMSHGHINDTIASYDGVYNLDEVFIEKIIRNDTLKGKPKIFIVAACKGTNFSEKCDAINSNDGNRLRPKTPPADRDVLKCFSTYEGFASGRLEAKGTHYIQTLCKKLEKKGMSLSIQDIMLQVTQRLSKDITNYQVPNTHSTMICHFCIGDIIRYNQFNFGGDNSNM